MALNAYVITERLGSDPMALDDTGYLPILWTFCAAVCCNTHFDKYSARQVVVLNAPIHALKGTALGMACRSANAIEFAAC